MGPQPSRHDGSTSHHGHIYKYLERAWSALSLASGMTNYSTNIDYSDSDFQVPKQVRKKVKRLEKHRREVITGNARTDQNHFCVGPEPGRDLFINGS